VKLEPLTASRWQDFEAVFRAPGCSVARGCWCMYYRYSGDEHPQGTGRERAAANKRALRRLAAGARPPGLIGYRGKTPVGWISLGPREDFRKLVHSPVMKAVDDEPVWSVICFVVPGELRGQGIAGAMLEGAKAWARRQGARLLEGYPVDKPARGADDSMWFGSKSMFDAAGFEEVARRKPTRPVVRLALKR